MPKSLYIDPVAVRQPGYIHFNDIPVCTTISKSSRSWKGNYTKTSSHLPRHGHLP